MFESIALRKTVGDSGDFDVGLLAEALVFYGSVHVIFESNTLISLVNKIGIDNILFLINNKYIKASFYPQILAVRRDDNKSGISRLRLSRIELAGKNGVPKSFGKREHILECVERGGIKARKKSINALIEKISFKRLGEGGELIDLAAKEDILNEKRFNKCFDIVAKSLCPTANPRHSVEYVKVHIFGEDLITEANFEIEKRFPGLKIDNVIATVLDAQLGLWISSSHGCELATRPDLSEIIQLKISGFVPNSGMRQADLFQEFIFGESRAVRDAINSGYKTFDEFLEFLDTTHKFKEWLRGVNVDEGLLREYNKAIAQCSFWNKLPAKSVRFSLFTGAGVLADFLVPTGVGTLGGVGVSLFDSFVLDKIMRGWKPNQFIESDFKPFLRRDN